MTNHPQRLVRRPMLGERGEVNTAAILAWTVLAVVAIAAINILFDDLVSSVFADVKERILSI